MITEKYCNEILQQYPEYITKDQMYRICHISKKTCLFLLESGLVPNIDSGKKTRRFKIKTVDVIQYLKDRDDYPELFKAPDGFYKGKGGDISVNPADKVERPKADKFIGSFYDSNEVQALFEAAKGTLIEIPIFLGAFYGLRRSEALGLKWDAIDFQNNTITIRHTVTSCNLDGKHIQIAQDTTKTKSSMRTLPLVPVFKEKLLKLKEQQEEYKRVCGRCYNKKYLEYICVDEMGTLISPHYLTSSFPKLLEKNNLRHIRFHDLRHSCASLLLANGVPMKQIQEWLGHSDFSTTANVYAHLDYNSKLSSADAMVNGLSGALEVIS